MRSEFSRKTRVLAFERAGGRCDGCGIKLTVRTGIHYDHIIPDAVGGANDVNNCSPLCKSCHSVKTTKTDVPAIAKTKATRDKHINAMPKGKGFRGWRNFRGEPVWKED